MIDGGEEAVAEAQALLDDMDDGWDSVSPDADSDAICALLGDSAVAACIDYRNGTYECSEAEQRVAARKELREIIRRLSV